MDPHRRRPSGEVYMPEPLSSHSRLRTAMRVPSDSGQLAIPYTRVRQVLLRYLSGILVDSVLDKAVHARNATPMNLSTSLLGEITSDIMIGLRLFVEEDQLPQLMLELAEILENDER
ncbi:MAG: hypothetical protein ABI488_17095 [Polyangiaceae bacterium]